MNCKSLRRKFIASCPLNSRERLKKAMKPKVEPFNALAVNYCKFLSIMSLEIPSQLSSASFLSSVPTFSCFCRNSWFPSSRACIYMEQRLGFGEITLLSGGGQLLLSLDISLPLNKILLLIDFYNTTRSFPACEFLHDWFAPGSSWRTIGRAPLTCLIYPQEATCGEYQWDHQQDAQALRTLVNFSLGSQSSRIDTLVNELIEMFISFLLVLKKGKNLTKEQNSEKINQRVKIKQANMEKQGKTKKKKEKVNKEKKRKNHGIELTWLRFYWFLDAQCSVGLGKVTSKNGNVPLPHAVIALSQSDIVSVFSEVAPLLNRYGLLMHWCPINPAAILSTKRRHRVESMGHTRCNIAVHRPNIRMTLYRGLEPIIWFGLGWPRRISRPHHVSRNTLNFLPRSWEVEVPLPDPSLLGVEIGRADANWTTLARWPCPRDKGFPLHQWPVLAHGPLDKQAKLLHRVRQAYQFLLSHWLRPAQSPRWWGRSQSFLHQLHHIEFGLLSFEPNAASIARAF
ncbi:hypothetical protein VP01_3052g2 [Puccinia sorghi]|uniref:Uncharacterized protein n=1 Tax=Puccinia sorghi TaxID=27349 RepID=A0A0L6UZX2_9BASI|nr:hypothetical protein VP01_3052g2 [Puccinia sorghi]